MVRTMALPTATPSAICAHFAHLIGARNSETDRERQLGYLTHRFTNGATDADTLARSPVTPVLETR